MSGLGGADRFVVGSCRTVKLTGLDTDEFEFDMVTGLMMLMESAAEAKKESNNT